MRVLLLINATLDAAREREIAAGCYPRKDYLELRHALGADVIDLGALERRPWTRLARRLAGPALAQALLAWRLSGRYDAIFADRETTGFALAALLALPLVGRATLPRDHDHTRPEETSAPGTHPAGSASRGAAGRHDAGAPRRHRSARRLPCDRSRRPRPRLTMIGHLLSPQKKQALFRALRLGRMTDCMIVHSSAQQRFATGALGLRPDQVALVPYQTDQRFWTPREAPPGRQICSAGLEYRDYGTLLDAADGLDVEVVIAAASHWSAHQGPGGDKPLPPNVRMASFDYAALRELYAASLFVVVPLHDVENQAGITTILEAMAMGKAVVVSHSRGQTDVVRDRRRRDRAAPERPTQPDWARTLGAAESTAQGQTGIYVRPYDAGELRRAIQFLLDHPEQARAMGANGRRLVEETMSLDHFTTRLAALIAGEPRAIPRSG